MTDRFEGHVRTGKPESFGYLRRPEFDMKDGRGHAWERPDGQLIMLSPGATVSRFDPRLRPSK